MAAIRGLLAVALIGLAAPAVRASDAVTVWTVEADKLGGGLANWRTLAIMHMAMHDAANAAHPVYARWAGPKPDEPPAGGARPEAALAAAAAQVLFDLYQDQRGEVAGILRHAVAQLPAGTDTEAGLRLGQAIGDAAVTARHDDGFEKVHDFVGSDVAGKWRPTPLKFATSTTDESRPFLFPARDSIPAVPPPIPGSPRYLQDVDEVRRLGSLLDSEATLAQSQAAVFWAFQSSQRGFMRLAVSLLDEKPRPGGLIEHARIMSQLAAALADSAIFAWVEKERFMFWRPVTAIDLGGFGVVADPSWRPFIETPPHPDYPSGHAADCFTGAGVLSAVFGPDLGPIDYVTQRGGPKVETVAVGMGQHSQGGDGATKSRHFTSLAAAADECSLSRIWAGAHFRSADDEAHRLAEAIVARALAAVPALAAAPPTTAP